MTREKAILGSRGDPMDPQKAFSNIKALTSPGGNGRRLAAVMRNLDPEERQDIAATVAQKVAGVVMTSSPGPMPTARNARCNAAVPDDRATACSQPL